MHADAADVIPRTSHSPVCNPARTSMPSVRTALRIAMAQRVARCGPSNIAKEPTPRIRPLLDDVRSAARAQTREVAQRLARFGSCIAYGLREHRPAETLAVDTWVEVAAEVVLRLTKRHTST